MEFTVGYARAGGHSLHRRAMLFNSPAFVLGFLPVALGGFFLAGRIGRTALGVALAGRRQLVLLWLVEP